MASPQGAERRAVLNFESKRYDLSIMSDELKRLVKGLQTAESQLKFAQDQLRVVAVGRQVLASQLKRKLSEIDPIEDWFEAHSALDEHFQLELRIPLPLRRLSYALGILIIVLVLEKFKLPLPRWQPAGLLAPLKSNDQKLRNAEIPLNTPDGLQVLKEAIHAADNRYRPKMIVDSLGQVSYRYSLREGEKKKSEAELKKLLETSRKNENYTRKIYRIIDTLTSFGVLVVIGEPLKKGASGEWDPFNQVLRLSPETLNMGSEVVLEILNHESIHVAQSCKAGGINYRPQPLALPLSPERITGKPLKSDVYASITSTQRRLEQEAYSYEYSNRAARNLLAEHCN